jgi:rRNA maturation RNase YbeY
VVKNLQINDVSKKIKKTCIHILIALLKDEFNFAVSSLAINFISSVRIAEINNKYLNHNFSTDIITFNYSGSSNILDGEIFISTEDAVYNAKKYKVDFYTEINRLVIHGILHLIGYDDKKSSDKLLMKRIENKLVKKFSNILNESDI